MESVIREGRLQAAEWVHRLLQEPHLLGELAQLGEQHLAIRAHRREEVLPVVEAYPTSLEISTVQLGASVLEPLAERDLLILE